MEARNSNALEQHKIGETEIINRVLQGEKELYEILVRRNNQKLYRVIRSYIRNEAEIEDLMQNTYLKAYENLSGFKQASTYATWLIRIGINEALARLREKGKVYNLSEQANYAARNTALQLSDQQMNPESKIIQNEAKRMLENAIDSLPLKYKTVYVLREVEGMPIQDISACLNLSVTNVKVRIHRAKNMLKDRLFEQALDQDIFEFGFGRCDRVTEHVMKLL